MENGAFAPKSKCSIFHNIFKCVIFQRRQTALLWSKRLSHFCLMEFPTFINWTNLLLIKGLLGRKFQVQCINTAYYSKTCVKRPLSKRQKIDFQDQFLLFAGQKYCRMLQGDKTMILMTNGSLTKASLSYHLSLRSLFCLFLSGRLHRFYCICMVWLLMFYDDFDSYDSILVTYYMK